MVILLSFFVRFLGICTNTAFFAVSLGLFMFAILVPCAEFMVNINAWPDAWLSEYYTPMSAMEQVAHTLKLTMIAIAFYTVGEKIESWSKKLPSLEGAEFKAKT